MIGHQHVSVHIDQFRGANLRKFGEEVAEIIVGEKITPRSMPRKMICVEIPAKRRWVLLGK